MKYLGLMFVLLTFSGCGVAPPPEVTKEVVPPPPPRDESHRFPTDGLVAATVVEGSILDQEFLPAGNMAVYKVDGQTFVAFLISYESSEKAALGAFDIKGHFTDPKFVAHFGGFQGTAGGGQWFIFPKNKAVGGVVGLPLEEADQFARKFAGLME